MLKVGVQFQLESIGIWLMYEVERKCSFTEQLIWECKGLGLDVCITTKSQTCVGFQTG